MVSDLICFAVADPAFKFFWVDSVRFKLVSTELMIVWISCGLIICLEKTFAYSTSSLSVAPFAFAALNCSLALRTLSSSSSSIRHFSYIAFSLSFDVVIFSIACPSISFMTESESPSLLQFLGVM